MERRVERSLIDLEHAARDLLDALADAPAVHGLEGRGLEDEEVEGALKDVGVGMHGALLDVRQERLHRSCRMSRSARRTASLRSLYGCFAALAVRRYDCALRAL